MKRRKFLIASAGSLAFGLNQTQNPAAAIDIEISDISETEPSNINSIVVNLDRLRIIPSYLDDSNSLDIQLSLQMSSEDHSNLKQADGINFNNGETLTLKKIRQRTGIDLSQITVGNLTSSDTRGSIVVKIEHPTIGSNTYRRNFVIPSPTIPRSVFADSLVAWYRFEDGDARDYTATLPATFAETTDYSGTVQNATYVSDGGVTDFKSGTNSGAFQFSGDNTNEYISLDPMSVNGLSNYTVSMWVENPTSEEYFLSMANNSRDNELIFGQNIDSSSWEHCVVTRENGSGNAYLNGTENSGFLWNNRFGSDPLNVDGFVIGQEQDSVNGGFKASQAHNGKVDDIRIYNEALSKSQINEIYNATKPN